MTVDSVYFPVVFVNDGDVEYTVELESIGDVFEVYKVPDDGSARTLLTEDFHYTVRYEEHLDPIKKRALITLAAPLSADSHLEVFRKTTIANPFTATALTPFEAESFEYALDRICFIQQEIEGHLCDCRGDTYPPPVVPPLPPECLPYECNAIENITDFGGTTGELWYWPLRTTLADGSTVPNPFEKGPNPPVGQPNLVSSQSGQPWGGTFGKLSRVALTGINILDVCDADTETYYAPYGPKYTAYATPVMFTSPGVYVTGPYGPTMAGTVSAKIVSWPNFVKTNLLWYGTGVLSYVGAQGIRAGSGQDFSFGVEQLGDGTERLGFQRGDDGPPFSGTPWMDYPPGFFSNNAHRIGWYIGSGEIYYVYAGLNTGRKGWNAYVDFNSYISVDGEIFGPFLWTHFLNVTYAVTNPPDETIPQDSLVYWQDSGLSTGRFMWGYMGWYHDLIVHPSSIEGANAYEDWVAAVIAFERNFNDYEVPGTCPSVETTATSSTPPVQDIFD